MERLNSIRLSVLVDAGGAGEGVHCDVTFSVRLGGGTERGGEGHGLEIRLY